MVASQAAKSLTQDPTIDANVQHTRSQSSKSDPVKDQRGLAGTVNASTGAVDSDRKAGWADLLDDWMIKYDPSKQNELFQ
ncbi:MAG: hypothetical protein ABW068_17395, partial [Candidatus Thiodiazotropha sp.]